MSFLFPRLIRITRPTQALALGDNGYSAETPERENLVADKVPCSIQFQRTGSAPGAGLPGDTANRTFWRVVIPLGAIDEGKICVRDILTDDLNVRYQVAANYWNSLGYSLRAERLEN